MARSRLTLGWLGHNLCAILAVTSHSDLQVPQRGMQGSQALLLWFYGSTGMEKALDGRPSLLWPWTAMFTSDCERWLHRHMQVVMNS